MKLQHIELENLKLSSLNVRRHGASEGLDELIASIRGLGVIQPLLVRSRGEGFEVIAGQRRLLACQAIAAQDGKAEAVPCAVLEEGDDALAIEASLAENAARLPMDEIDQYEAFAAVRAQGRSIEEIAARFGVTELLVRRRLAIAGLIPQVLALYRKGDIEADTLRQMTMASRAQQKAWLKLVRDPDNHAPTGRRLKAWLFGAEIPTGAALFPLDQYGGTIVADLFGEQAYFDDAEKFWKVQMQAVIHKQAAYLEAGWSDVIIMGIGARWNPYDKVKRGKRQGGKVYISCASNGEIGFHEGWLDEKEAKRRDKEAARADARGDDKPQTLARPELTKAAIRYLDLHRQNAVRAELLKNPRIALRLIAASVIAGDGLWDVRPEKQSANGNAAIAASVAGSKATEAFEAERAAVRELLGSRSGDAARTCPLLARLLAMTDDELLRVLALLMAESLPAGSAAVEALGHILEVDMAQWWTPDEAFFDLLRDKPAINAMLAEVAGADVARARLTQTARVQKDVIAAHIAGKAGRKAPDWKPRYMRFPMQPYTKRKGLPAIDQWNAVKKLFAVKL